MIVLPGGMPGTLNLEGCEPLMEKVKEFDKNGKTVDIQVDGNAHQLVVKGGMLVSKMLVIPEGTENFDFNVYLKMHAMESEIVVE